VTLAALRDGDNLSFTTLQDLIGLTPGNLITYLRKLQEVSGQGFCRCCPACRGA
jgi:hypothetical protein